MSDGKDKDMATPPFCPECGAGSDYIDVDLNGDGTADTECHKCGWTNDD